MKVYLGETKNAREYKINEYQRRNLDDDGNYEYRLDVYGKYENAISRILNELRNDEVYLTSEEFYHIVWYGLKG